MKKMETADIGMFWKKIADGIFKVNKLIQGKNILN